jgi:hypothetical protein
MPILANKQLDEIFHRKILGKLRLCKLSHPCRTAPRMSGVDEVKTRFSSKFVLISQADADKAPNQAT